ncbi:substrate binding domain-containing protein [Alteromonas sp. W364]|uniref:substrate binding domain-containing protein n=1 Tax=Alteromonas sp. W364 TaxID=3075610 RepID=UPI0028858C3C|nr:substrate binding domain-containing protein [Alteromonas sp. W364]MDT0629317.1 substrate binding domain-containing protein [Alteromonas sp. W364]
MPFKKVSGTLRFASSSTFAQLFIAPILPKFTDQYPQINLELKLSDTQMNLIDGGYDLALRNYAVEDSSLIGRKLADDTRILCASPDYLKKYGIPKEPSDLEQHQLIFFDSNKTRKLVSTVAGESYAFPLHPVKSRVICDDGSSIRIAAKAGLGICMSSIWNVHTELKEGSLVRVLPDYKYDDNVAVWLVYPKSNVLTAKVRVFIDFLIENIQVPSAWHT